MLAAHVDIGSSFHVLSILEVASHSFAGEFSGWISIIFNRSILECTDLKSFLKNVVTCHTFKDFNFNVSAPQIINKRSENFIY